MALSKFNPLKKGSEGTDVTTLQRILTFLSYLVTDRNGFFGDTTEKSVIALQKANKKIETGQVEKEAFSHLKKTFSEKTAAEIKKGEGKNYFVFGRVVNEKSQLGVKGLRVEAWDKDWIFHDSPLGEAKSTAGGWFRIDFKSKEAQEWIVEREPDLFFSIYEGKKLVANTVNSIRYKVELPDVELIIPVPVASGDKKPEPVLTFLELVKSKFSISDRPFTNLLTDEIIKIGSIAPVEQIANLSRGEIAEIIALFPATSNFFNTLAKDIYIKAKKIFEEDAKLPKESINAEPNGNDSLQALKTADPDEYNKAIATLNQTVKNQNLWQQLVNTYAETIQPGLDALTRHLRSEWKNDNFLTFFKNEEREIIAELKSAMAGLHPTHPFINIWASIFHTGVMAGASERRRHYRFTGQVVNTIEKEKKGIYGLRVHTQLLFPNQKDPVDLGFQFTNSNGYFSVDYSILSDEQKDNYPFLFTVYKEKGGKEIITKKVNVSVALNKVIELDVKLEREPFRRDVKLENVLKLGKYPGKLAKWLNEKGLTNFTQIAAKGGLRNIKGLPVDADSDVVKKLEGHTNLSLFSDDVAFNETLINKGYPGIKQIASTPGEVFIKNVGKEVGEFRAYIFHAGARHAHQYMTNLLVEQANDRHLAPEGELMPLQPLQVCECEECNSVVSPLAYLAELLDYVLNNIKDSGNNLTTSKLDELFHQPFGRLPVSCSLMKEQVCQIRLATEILWKEYNKVLHRVPQLRRDALEKKVAEYTLLTYQTILQQLGTSYEEIRLIRYQRNETSEEFESRKKTLANRIGIDLRFVDLLVGTSNTLGVLFKDSATRITETDLETLFGFRDTKRDVLSSTPISAIQRWRLAHLRTLWRERDWINDEYIRNELPVIDPDIIGIDDLRNPVAGETVFDTWQKRRIWVDDLIIQFAGYTIRRGIYREFQVIQVPGVNLSNRFIAGSSFDITGSTGNDGPYTIIAVKYENEDSFLFLNEAIPDANADGNVEFNISRNIFSIEQSDKK